MKLNEEEARYLKEVDLIEAIHKIRREAATGEMPMKTLSAIYKGNRTVELPEDPNLPENTTVLVMIPERGDEAEMRRQLQSASEAVFAKLWDNKEDEVWNEYL